MLNDFKYTRSYPDNFENVPIGNSVYIFGLNLEERSHFPLRMKEHRTDMSFLEAKSLDRYSFELNGSKYAFSDFRSVTDLLTSLNCSAFYLDVTGLENSINAFFVKVIVTLRKAQFYVVYVEPREYDIVQFRQLGQFKDLSEKINGIYPLPGTTNLTFNKSDFYFYPFIGFEGGRFKFMVENVQPLRDKIKVIIGLPGFRLEYQNESFLGNRTVLSRPEFLDDVRKIPAHSLTDAFLLVKNHLLKDKDVFIKLAPIGAKPHVIACILLANLYPRSIELFYDNPQRKLKRSFGVSYIHLYNISALITAD